MLQTTNIPLLLLQVSTSHRMLYAGNFEDLCVDCLHHPCLLPPPQHRNRKWSGFLCHPDDCRSFPNFHVFLRQFDAGRSCTSLKFSFRSKKFLFEAFYVLIHCWNIKDFQNHSRFISIILLDHHFHAKGHATLAMDIYQHPGNSFAIGSLNDGGLLSFLWYLPETSILHSCDISQCIRDSHSILLLQRAISDSRKSHHRPPLRRIQDVVGWVV